MISWRRRVAFAAGTLVVVAALFRPQAEAQRGLPWVAVADDWVRPASDGGARDASPDTAAGRAIFAGKGNCHVCHGVNAKGTVLAPDLTDGEWLNSDGSLASIVKVVKEGVATPKKYPAPMPPMGGVALTDAEVRAVSEYVHAISGEAEAGT